MNYCPNCGKQVDENTFVCLNCGVKLKNDIENNNGDSGSIGWGILGYFIPIAGLIIYLVMMDSRPKTAKMAGKGALISVVVNTILSILLFVLFFRLVAYN